MASAAMLTSFCSTPLSFVSGSALFSARLRFLCVGAKPRNACQALHSAGNQVSVPFEIRQRCKRREIFFGGVLAGLSAVVDSHCALADPPAGPMSLEPSFAVQVDEINACSYVYPVGIPNKSFNLSWTESRKPERYSSAAPLAPDARQRIVSERLDYKNSVVISVAIGPPSSVFLKSKDTSTWDAKDVARSVLSDKSTARMTSGQRVAEIAILDSRSEVIDGIKYWYYEYLTQKSPTNSEYSGDVYRHSVAATAEREGFLYSLNASTLDARWRTMGPLLSRAVSSFHLLPPTADYVPPYKDPWRFW